MKRRTFLSAVGSMAAAPMLLRAASGVPLKIGQIGTAHAHASGKMRAIRAAPADWEMVGLVEPDPRLAPQVLQSEPYGGLTLLTETQLLRMRDLRVVAVETGIEDCCDTALRVIKSGSHVHLDKPGALGHGEFKAMRLEAEKRGLVVQMGYMLRYNPAFEFLFRAVRERWLGEIREIDASMGKLSTGAELDAIRKLPGGSMFELGCHLIDVIHTLLGPPSSVRAFSTSEGGDGLQDNQLAVLVYPRATATVRTNISNPFGFPRRHFTVTGTEGVIEILPLESGQIKLSLTSSRHGYNQGTTPLQLDRQGGRYDGEFRDLARVIRGEKQFAWSARHDIAVHQSVLQASGVGV